jgi:Domain of unknown function (DUF1818)
MAQPIGKLLREGPGWRLGWNPDAPVYQGLVGGQGWAFELTTEELADFCRLLAELAATMAAMAEELMDEERISCEAEGDRLWLEVEGVPTSYDLYVIVQGPRASEGFWPAAVVPELVAAAQSLRTF